MRALSLVLLLTMGCKNRSQDVRPAPDGTDAPTAPATEPGTELFGFIGSPCTTDADCPYDAGTCLTELEGFPRGMCSASCDGFCDDAEGHPTTFCSTVDSLPTQAARLGDGGCSSRCDFGLFPYTGCRADYGCASTARANDPASITYTCMPEASSDLTSCLQDLAGRGVPFTPTLIADASPEDAPNLTCHVEDPIDFPSGYLGVDIVYSGGSTPGKVKGSCTLGHALADTIEGLQPAGVITLRHLGTTVCRTIAGTNTLSRHSYGDAIDISGFDFDDGSTITLQDHWEHDTPSPVSLEAQWLYGLAQDWHAERLWNTVLTPNFDIYHDNHFHLDLTPGADYLGAQIDPHPLVGESLAAER